MRTRNMSIANLSEVPLLYHLARSGSIASGSISFVGPPSGVVLPFETKEVEFVFQPTLGGAFLETVRVCNLLDPGASEALVFKAQIVKPNVLAVSPTDLDFGDVLVDSPQATQRTLSFSIRNISKRERVFEIEAAFTSEHSRLLEPVLDVSVGDAGSAARTTEIEEMIERLEHKRKIYIRKAKTAKLPELERQLAMLRAGQIPKEVGLEEDDAKVTTATATSQSASSQQLRPRENKVVRVAVAAEASVPVSVVLAVLSTPQASSARRRPVRFDCALTVREQKNSDVSKTVGITAFVFFDSAAAEAETKRLSGEEEPTHPFVSEQQASPPSLQIPATEMIVRGPAFTITGLGEPPTVIATSDATPIADAFLTFPRWLGASTSALTHDFGLSSRASEPTRFVIRWSNLLPDERGDAARQPAVGELVIRPKNPSDEVPLADDSVFRSPRPRDIDGDRAICVLVPADDVIILTAELSIHVGNRALAMLARLRPSISPANSAGSSSAGSLSTMASAAPPQPAALSTLIPTPGLAPVDAAPGLPEASSRIVEQRLNGSILVAPETQSHRLKTIEVSVIANTKLLELSQTKYDLGEVFGSSEFSSEITLSSTVSFPLRFQIVSAPLGSAGSSPVPPTATLSQQTESFSPMLPLASLSSPARSSNTGPLFQFSTVSGIIPPFGKYVVTFSCQPEISGKQTHSFIVRTLNNMSDETVSVSLLFRHLRFPDLSAQGSVESSLSLGVCYMPQDNKSFARVVPFLIENTSGKTIEVSVQTNLARKLAIFRDSEMRDSLETCSLTLQPHAIHTVYVAVVSQNINFHNSLSRELRGGARFLVNGHEEEPTLRISAIVGKSMLSVSPALIDLGAVMAVGTPLRTSFVVSNLSTTHAAVFSVIPDRAISASVSSGVVYGTENPQSLPHEHIVELEFTPTEFGVCHHVITVLNHHNPAQQLSVAVSLFVDDGSLCAETGAKFSSATPNSGGDLMPLLQLGDVLLCPAASSTPVSSAAIVSPTQSEALSVVSSESSSKGPAAPLPETEISVPVVALYHSFTLKNQSSEPLLLRPSASLPAELTVTRQQGHLPTPSDVTSASVAEFCAHPPPVFATVCKEPFELASGETVTVTVGHPATVLLKGQDFSAIQRGRKVPFYGALFFERWLGSGRSRISHIVRAHGALCVSTAEIKTQQINVGTIGYVNQWKPVSVEIVIANTSETSLHLVVDPLPQFLSLDSATPGSLLAASGTQLTIRLWLHPEIYSEMVLQEAASVQSNTTATTATTTHSAGSSPFDSAEAAMAKSPASSSTTENILEIVRFTNLRNPFNSLACSISGVLLRNYASLSPLTVRSIILPPLSYGANSDQAPPCTTTLAITNNFSEPLSIQATVAENFPFAKLKLKSKASSQAVFSFLVQPQETYQLRVDCETEHGATGAHTTTRLPLKIQAAMTHKSPEIGLLFGTLSLTYTPQSAGPSVTERVCVKGMLVHLPTFSVSVSSLSFHFFPPPYTKMNGDERQEFWIKNISNEPLQFGVELLAKRGWSGLLVRPTSGTIQSKQSILISVSLDFPQGMNEDIESVGLVVVDVNAPAPSKTLPVTFHRRIPNLEQTASPALGYSQPLSPYMTPVQTHVDSLLQIQGCTLFPHTHHRYEVNFGQCDYGSGSTEWRFSVSTNSVSEVEFKLAPINSESDFWLSLSCQGGVVSSQRACEVTLTIATDTMGMFATFLVLYNLSNPRDINTVRVACEVVLTRTNTESLSAASALSSSASLFSLKVDGLDIPNPLIDFGDVYHGSLYHDRSFALENEMDMPLEFLVSSNLSWPVPHELHFSLSHTSPKLVSTIRLAARERVRVFLYLAIRPTTDKELNIDISITCRLMKDYVRTMRVRGRVRSPSLSLSHTSLLFTLERSLLAHTLGRSHSSLSMGVSQTVQREPVSAAPNVLSPTPSYVETMPAETLVENLMRMLSPQSITLTNVSSRNVVYEIRNDSPFVDILGIPLAGSLSPTSSESGRESDGAREGTIDRPASSRLITVAPKIDMILSNKEWLLNEMYIDTHFTVYNRMRPSERSWVTVRFSCGFLHRFYAAPSGKRNAARMNSLEGHLLRFLSQFAALFCPPQLATPSTPSRPRVEGNADATGESMADSMPPLVLGSPAQSFFDRRGSRSRPSDRTLLSSATVAATSTGGDATPEAGPLGGSRHTTSLDELVADVVRSSQHARLLFELEYLTDELIYYALRGRQLGESIFRAANLLYGVLYAHDVFQWKLTAARGTLLAPWILPLKRFLCHFPDKVDHVQHLRRTLRTLEQQSRLDMPAIPSPSLSDSAPSPLPRQSSAAALPVVRTAEQD
eukprot:TRINITY_DN5294_c0_g1_i2.p1 TRINITY_DN5294_c0_g1~~TRINITY_DN5294_c0_g1_i2.p1  ORF type:complete len:2470 (-),score=501.56 TRINITY_DN5294_c0_g1_i2:14-6991(-)